MTGILPLLNRDFIRSIQGHLALLGLTYTRSPSPWRSSRFASAAVSLSITLARAIPSRRQRSVR